MLIVRSCLVLLLATLPLAAGGLPTHRIEGPVTVIDGDTMDMNGTRIRLAVVDAPEHDQSCDLAGKPMACGQAARHLLETLTAGHTVTCDLGPNLTHGRVVGYCAANGQTLNLALLAAGAGIIAPQFLAEWPAQSAALLAAEDFARQHRKGVWGMHAVPPAAFRAAGPASDCPADRPVKANISDKGRIYHLPGDRHYGRTRITLPGEACLATAAEAAAAGFRHARS